MSVNLRLEQCCSVLVDGVRCLRPARELGGLCSAHWQAALPETRATLQWEASWADEPWDLVAQIEQFLSDR